MKTVSMKPIVQKPRKDGFWAVYIRFTLDGRCQFWKTSKVVSSQNVKSKSEITDPHVLSFCSSLILQWMEKLNHVDYSMWSLKDIVEYVTNDDSQVSFSSYSRTYIEKIDKPRTAKNYTLALRHLERYMGTCELMFQSLTESSLKAWIDTMVRDGKKRAKEMYPVCIRHIWRNAMKELNVPEQGIVRIKYNPWERITIPQSDDTVKQAKSPNAMRTFFSCPIPTKPFAMSLMEFGRDVAKMAFCLGGMYCADLYELKKEDYYDGIIHYNRAKTKHCRKDSAYMEMRVPDIIKPLFKKYSSSQKKGPLFCFHEMYATEDSFCANVNSGIRQICQKIMGLSKEEDYSILTFRHTWATIAFNELGLDWQAVAFAMNHGSAHRVTQTYVKKDFSPAWELNDKVVEFIFFSDNPGKEELRREEKKLDTDRISQNNLLRGTAFYKGKVVAEEEKTGFTNKGQLVALLMKRLPKDIPTGAIVQFVIENLDKGGKWMYEHQKGKGFH